MYNMQKSLNGVWRLYIIENKDCKNFAQTVSCETEIKARGFTAIDGCVPGNFELDMQKAGLIGDPFYGDNPHKIQN